MDRIWASTDGTSELTRRTSADDYALPSRGEAIVALRPALEAQAGPVLVTGEPGVGKTWLWRRLQAEMPATWRWGVVDVPPTLGPDALYRLIGHRLGLGFGAPVAGVEDGARLDLADFLREATADGIRWALVLDEAHNATAALLEEVRLLANRLGGPDGLSALIVVGQTSLAGRLAVRPLKALAARLSAHVHLRCLDVEEARALLNRLAPAVDWDDRTLERHHRDAGGNPRRMLIAARGAASGAVAMPADRIRERSLVASPPSPPVVPQPSARTSGTPAATRAGDDWDSPVVGPFKPPLRVGDGMIEVGWEAGLESEPQPGLRMTLDPDLALEAGLAPDFAATPPTFSMTESPSETGPVPVIGSEPERDLEAFETIDDHYAALQAWNEWARNQGRNTLAPAVEASAPARLDRAASPAIDRAADPSSDPEAQPSVRVESPQAFAPYSQLFSRLREIRDANESS